MARKRKSSRRSSRRIMGRPVRAGKKIMGRKLPLPNLRVAGRNVKL